MTTPLVVVDTSIWIDHIHHGDPQLASLLRRRAALLHPMAIGEIALGSLRNRAGLIAELRELPRAEAVSDDDVVAVIEDLELFNTGIGFVDAHLLASARFVHGGQLWTRDKKLHAQAQRLGIAFPA